MTVKQLALFEQVSERQIQRYLHEGFQGHVLPAVRIGRSFQITEPDYREWRRVCGFDEPEAQQPEVLRISQGGAESALPSEPGEVIAPEPDRPAYPPYPQGADPNGVLTNVPNEHSRNWPHPLAIRDYFAEQARKMKAHLRGYDDEN